MTTDRAANSPQLSGLTLILLATIASGVASYVVTWLVPHYVGFAAYTTFAVFWAFIYLVVGTLSGIQQEVTRATRELDARAPAPASRARTFALGAALVVLALILATAPAWVDRAFPEDGWSLIWPLALGTSSFVFVAVLGGSLYGISQWPLLALMMVTDALLRLIAIVGVLAFTKDVVSLAWAVALPFPATIVLLWPFIRRFIVGRTALDVGYLPLIRNVGQTMVAAGSTAVMVSGFPLVLGLASVGQSRTLVGLYILSITLTRAPLIIVVMSLQSFLIVTFRDAEHLGARVIRILGLLVATGCVLAVAGWLAGPAVFAFLFPGELVPDGWFIAVLVFSSALVGSLSVTGPAVLALSRHLAYSLGWLVAAVVTVVMLLLPFDFTTRTILALVVGPSTGLLIHGVYLVGVRRRTRAIDG